MYGYQDYRGPAILRHKYSASDNETQNNEESSSEYDEELDPLRPGIWMEGDSLAPPCGCDLNSIESLLDLASVDSNDVLYDLGCGDGRICFEALCRRHCRQCVGVEIEDELVERFQQLAQETLQVYQPVEDAIFKDSVEILDLNCQNKGPDKSQLFQRVVVVPDDLQKVLSALVENMLVGPQQQDLISYRSPNDTDIHILPPTVIIIFLLPEAIQQIEYNLVQMLKHNKRLRLVCNTWGLKTIEPVATAENAFLYMGDCK